MRKHTLIIIILVSAFLFPQPSIDLVEGGDVEHISLIIYEDLINEFFSNMGKIKKKEKNYEWALKNPRISIKDKKAIFEAEIQVKNSLLSVTKDVLGKVDVSYDKEENIILVSVVEADVIVDIAGYDIGKIDIGKHFKKSLKLNGPQAVSEYVEFPLPNGDIRKVDIEVKSYSLDLIDGAIKESTSLGFKSETVSQ